MIYEGHTVLSAQSRTLCLSSDKGAQFHAKRTFSEPAPCLRGEGELPIPDQDVIRANMSFSVSVCHPHAGRADFRFKVETAFSTGT